MRSVRRAAVAAVAATAAALSAVLLTAAPVSAGGPTSVLLVAPQHGASAALHNTNEAYDRLATALNRQPVAQRAPHSQPPDLSGSNFVATWMIHDVQPWRVDRIMLGGNGLPEWIHTTESVGGDVDLGAEGVWHRPSDPTGLMVILKGLGLTGGIAPGADPADAAQDTAADEADGALPAPSGPGNGAAWAVPAVVAGAVAGVLGERWLRRRREQGEGGRWQLLDVPGR
ncbi:hypothetical protein [Jiangella asiatica]|uniref:Uncharacterized protein n=1 Tax=Jiangella asiatica TaxID=2530372 RepID=A0A4V2Z434_9ACTN|nr:hypothetical protein [Jiangella asiatica]TDE15078.1 hypothetical protein E1269_02955 [Jiangella asiatica]